MVHLEAKSATCADWTRDELPAPDVLREGWYLMLPLGCWSICCSRAIRRCSPEPSVWR